MGARGSKDFTQIKIEGLREVTKSLKALEPEAGKQIKAVLDDAARIVVNTARPRVPSLTGAARASIVVKSTVRESRIRVGGPKAPYYPWLDYGGKTGRKMSVHRKFERHGRYLYPAYGAQMQNVQKLLQKRLTLMITNAGLTPDDPS
jgi:hypothetical protein